MYNLMAKIQDEVYCFMSFAVDEILSSQTRKHVNDNIELWRRASEPMDWKLAYQRLNL